jgi:hypothetical protein
MRDREAGWKASGARLWEVLGSAEVLEANGPVCFSSSWCDKRRVDSISPAICLLRRPVATRIMICRSRELSISKRSLSAAHPSRSACRTCVNENCADRRRTDELFEPAVTFPDAKVREMLKPNRPTFFGTSVKRVAPNSEAHAPMDRRSNVAQPAITRTMIVPHIVFTMLATG